MCEDYRFYESQIIMNSVTALMTPHNIVNPNNTHRVQHLSKTESTVPSVLLAVLSPEWLQREEEESTVPSVLLAVLSPEPGAQLG